MNIIPGQTYRHFKGNEYEVICIARHTESEEDLVIYRSVNNPNAIYARPVAMFESEVDSDKYPDADQKMRFEPVGAGASDTFSKTGSADTFKEDDFINGTGKAASAERESVPGIDPKVMDFLDTDDFEKKLNILADLRGKVTESMLNTMAFSVDFEFNEGSVEEMYEELLNCITLRAKFECSRLR
ncbi:MAG: DUF1653 domain-containing protein [Lachnospiraceae bacterium]|nr:DUF1653 domain-containing protein [Lachnospiraceae bacterium]